MTTKEIKDLILATIICFSIALLVSYGCIKFTDSLDKKIKPIPISYPEEICLAKKGDTLVVINVADSIYLGFKKEKL